MIDIQVGAVSAEIKANPKPLLAAMDQIGKKCEASVAALETKYSSVFKLIASQASSAQGKMESDSKNHTNKMKGYIDSYLQKYVANMQKVKGASKESADKATKEFKEFAAEVKKLNSELTQTKTKLKAVQTSSGGSSRSSGTRMGTEGVKDAMAPLYQEMWTMPYRMEHIGRAMYFSFSRPLQYAFGEMKNTVQAFESSLLTVQGILGKTNQQFQKFSDLAVNISRTTYGLIVDAANVMKILAKAGVGDKGILNITGDMVNFGLAMDMNAEKAASMSIQIANAFKIPVADMGQYTDMLAKATNSANMELNDLLSAMSYVAPIAKIAGSSMSEMSVVIGTLADSGIKGTKAGTLLRNVYMRLLAPTSTMTKMIKKYGLELKTSSGEMKDFIGVIEEFQNKKVSGEDILSGFRQRAGPGMIKAVESDTAMLRASKQAIDSAVGYVDKLVETKMSGLEGSLKRIAGAKERIGKSLFEKVFADQLRTAAGLLEKVATWMENLSEASVKAIGHTLELAAAFGKVMMVVGIILRVNKMLTDLGRSFLLLFANLGKVRKGIVSVNTALIGTQATSKALNATTVGVGVAGAAASKKIVNGMKKVNGSQLVAAQGAAGLAKTIASTGGAAKVAEVGVKASMGSMLTSLASVLSIATALSFMFNHMFKVSGKENPFIGLGTKIKESIGVAVGAVATGFSKMKEFSADWYSVFLGHQQEAYKENTKKHHDMLVNAEWASIRKKAIRKLDYQDYKASLKDWLDDQIENNNLMVIAADKLYSALSKLVNNHVNTAMKAFNWLGQNVAGMFNELGRILGIAWENLSFGAEREALKAARALEGITVGPKKQTTVFSLLGITEEEFNSLENRISLFGSDLDPESLAWITDEMPYVNMSEKKAAAVKIEEAYFDKIADMWSKGYDDQAKLAEKARDKEIAASNESYEKQKASAGSAAASKLKTSSDLYEKIYELTHTDTENKLRQIKTQYNAYVESTNDTVAAAKWMSLAINKLNEESLKKHMTNVSKGITETIDLYIKAANVRLDTLYDSKLQWIERLKAASEKLHQVQLTQEETYHEMVNKTLQEKYQGHIDVINGYKAERAQIKEEAAEWKKVKDVVESITELEGQRGQTKTDFIQSTKAAQFLADQSIAEALSSQEIQLAEIKTQYDEELVAIDDKKRRLEENLALEKQTLAIKKAQVELDRDETYRDISSVGEFGREARQEFDRYMQKAGSGMLGGGFNLETDTSSIWDAVSDFTNKGRAGTDSGSTEDLYSYFVDKHLEDKESNLDTLEQTKQLEETQKEIAAEEKEAKATYDVDMKEIQQTTSADISDIKSNLRIDLANLDLKRAIESAELVNKIQLTNEELIKANNTLREYFLGVGEDAKITSLQDQLQTEQDNEDARNQQVLDRLDTIADHTSAEYAFEIASLKGGKEVNKEAINQTALQTFIDLPTVDLQAFLAEWIPNWETYGETMGEKLIEGMILGIKDDSKLLLAVDELSEHVLTSMNEALGIHSPSVKAEEMSKQLLRGRATPFKQGAEKEALLNAIGDNAKGISEFGAASASEAWANITLPSEYNKGTGDFGMDLRDYITYWGGNSLQGAQKNEQKQRDWNQGDPYSQTINVYPRDPSVGEEVAAAIDKGKFAIA